MMNCGACEEVKFLEHLKEIMEKVYKNSLIKCYFKFGFVAGRRTSNSLFMSYRMREEDRCK